MYHSYIMGHIFAMKWLKIQYTWLSVLHITVSRPKMQILTYIICINFDLYIVIVLFDERYLLYLIYIDKI